MNDPLYGIQSYLSNLYNFALFGAICGFTAVLLSIIILIQFSSLHNHIHALRAQLEAQRVYDQQVAAQQAMWNHQQQVAPSDPYYGHNYAGR